MISQKTYSWILIIGGAVGILMSFLLTLDKIELLKNPAAQLPCNINPVVSCGPIINTPQASAFGVPNPLLGLIGYSIVFTVGAFLLFGTNPRKSFWILFYIGLIFATIFIHWLIFQSVYRIGALCIYCMITWVVTLAIVIYTKTWILQNYPYNFGQRMQRFALKNHLAILISWYLIITLAILIHFRDFFFS